MNLSRISISIGISLKRSFGLGRSSLRLVMKAWTWPTSLSYQSIWKFEYQHVGEENGNAHWPREQGFRIPISWLRASPAQKSHPGFINGELWLSRLRPPACAVRKRTSSSCSIVYPAKILTILRPKKCEHSTMRPYLPLYKVIITNWSRSLVDVEFKGTKTTSTNTTWNRWYLTCPSVVSGLGYPIQSSNAANATIGQRVQYYHR